MIKSLYELTNKGVLKPLSFVSATLLFIAIALFSKKFTAYFGGHQFYLAILVFYGMSILWIHGVGFEIKSTVMKFIFMPLLGYIIVYSALIYLVVSP